MQVKAHTTSLSTAITHHVTDWERQSSLICRSKFCPNFFGRISVAETERIWNRLWPKSAASPERFQAAMIQDICLGGVQIVKAEVWGSQSSGLKHHLHPFEARAAKTCLRNKPEFREGTWPLGLVGPAHSLCLFGEPFWRGTAEVGVQRDPSRAAAESSPLQVYVLSWDCSPTPLWACLNSSVHHWC